MSANLPLRPDLEGEAPYGAPEIDVPVRLNVNENPYPPSMEVIESIATAVARAAQGLNRYPERDFPRLREALADYLEAESGVHLTPEQIWAANGSNEVMLHVLQAFGGPGRTCLTFTPTYSMYPEYARDTLTDYVTRPRREDFTLDVETAVAAISELRPAVVILASPNNPTGTALPLEDIDRILEAARGHGPMLGAEIGSPARAGDCGVVIDEAYAVVRLPYHLSAVTQAAALAALSHRDELMAQVASLRDERDALVAWLRGRGLTAHESDANFVLFGPFPDREAVWQALLDAGILIRVVGPEGFLRASIGTPEEMERLRSALATVIGG